MTPGTFRVFETPNFVSMPPTDGGEVKKCCVAVTKICPLYPRFKAPKFLFQMEDILVLQCKFFFKI
jgi:hypothetical protein